MAPYWSFLPDELLRLISEKITSMEHYVYFRSVCQQWRRACTPHPHHLIDQVPWMWLLTKQSSYTVSFYNFMQSKIYNFDLPNDVHNKHTVWSCGWILVQNDKEFSLFNPITRDMKHNCLPSLTSPPTILGFARNEKTKDPSHYNIYQEAIPRKIILTSCPSDEGCIVVAQFREIFELAFCRVGDNSWIVLKLKEYGHGSCRILDFNYKNGFVYAINNRGQITIYDLRDLSMKILELIGNLTQIPGFRKLYLIQGEGELDGVPLLVISKDGSTMEEFEVYKCVTTRGESRWRRLRNIGSKVLIVGHKQCEIVSLDSDQLNRW